jgi:hypothetical protein
MVAGSYRISYPFKVALVARRFSWPWWWLEVAREFSGQVVAGSLAVARKFSWSCEAMGLAVWL